MIDGCIRVLHVLGSARAGGVETFVLELARKIDRRRFHISVIILGSNGPMVEALRAAGAAVYVLGVGERFWRGALSFYHHAWANRFNILHTNVGGRLPRYLARLAGCRVIIMHVHGPGGEEVGALREGSPALARRIKRTYLSGAHHLVSCSHAIARMLAACYPALVGRILVVPYGVDLDRLQPVLPGSSELSVLRHELGLSEENKVVGFVGRLVPQKGLSYLLAAAEMLQTQYSNLYFVIIGDGPLRAEIEAATVLFGNKRFLFLGERSDVPRLMSLFDLLVVPSEWEGLPIVILEAMAMAKPVVAFDVDGIPEAVVHGETGLLVPHRDSQALASAITRLLDDALLRRRMGAAGRRKVEQRFDVRGMTQTFESFYETVTCRGTTSTP